MTTVSRDDAALLSEPALDTQIRTLWWEGFSLRKIADRLGVSHETVRQRLLALLNELSPELYRKRRDGAARLDAVYDALVAYKQAHDGCAPAIRELMELTRYASTSGVVDALRRLQQQGRVRLGGGARQIYVVGAAWSPPDGEV